MAALVFGAGFFGLIRDISSGVFGDISLTAAMAQSMGSSLATIATVLLERSVEHAGARCHWYRVGACRSLA